MIVFACARCAKPYRLKPEFAGRTTQCTGCKEPLVVPQAAAVARDRIAFACGECGMKFSVPRDCAGRATKCPTCKEALTVPRPDETLAEPPSAGQIQGAPSSLARAGVDAAVSLTADSGSPGSSSAWQHLLDAKGHDGARYVVESEIARGGMGAVMRAVDRDIRREVAVKYLLDQADAGKKLRFVEEAQITGQLEHPNIVPIHELGVDAQQRIFFAMKMVKGRSLAQILTALREEPHSAEKEYSLNRLLILFVNVCNALAYAHARGVVHRDLKPANIMVGDFGEVYVMDWGLAKVLKRSTAAPVLAVPLARLANPAASPFDFTAPSAPLAAPVAPSEPASGASQVVTSRDGDADLTQDGAVAGTPVYMPPEQAAGQLANIDERSDVYAMGAILYELLTLQPPISKDGGYWPILLRVTQGQITPPELKASERARAGKVPAELAAVAMKALAKRKQDRYPSIARLRQDVERFMEGRSVSAKEDTVREMAVKLIKRNQGVSIATATAALLLAVVGLWSLTAVLRANARTRSEEQAKLEQAKRAVPSFVRAAPLLVTERQFDDALAQVNAALNSDPDEAEARWLRALLLLTQEDYVAARADLEAYLRLRPERAPAQALLELARKARGDDKATLLGLADELNRQGAYAFVDRTLKRAEQLQASRQELLERFRQRLEAAGPGYGGRLTLNPAAEFELNLRDSGIGNLEPLRGLPLVHLNLASCGDVMDLGPLQGMPLHELHLSGCGRVIDLAALRGMPLATLYLGDTAVWNLSPLEGMPLISLDLGNCQQIADLAPLKGLPLSRLNLTYCSKVHDLRPLANVPLTSLDLHFCTQLSLTQLKGMKLTHLGVRAWSQLTDLEPLAGMLLISLDLTDCSNVTGLAPLARMRLTSFALTGAGKVKDLAPLTGMPLTQLLLSDCKEISNLSPLTGMPLAQLNLSGCKEIGNLAPLTGMPLTQLILGRCGRIEQLTPLSDLKTLRRLDIDDCAVKDLAPLKGLPLTMLNVSGCPVTDLAPLTGMLLEELRLTRSQIGDLTPLAGMKSLRWLAFDDCPVKDLTPLKELRLGALGIGRCPVNDLTPLRGMPLTVLNLNQCAELHDLTPLQGTPLGLIELPPLVTKGMDVVRGLPSLQNVNRMGAAEFWKQWDAKAK